jgi:hypothetical protein
MMKTMSGAAFRIAVLRRTSCGITGSSLAGCPLEEKDSPDDKLAPGQWI